VLTNMDDEELPSPVNANDEEHVRILIDFLSVWSRISFERVFDNEVLLESLSLSFERIRHFCQAKLSLQFRPKSHIYIGL